MHNNLPPLDGQLGQSKNMRAIDACRGYAITLVLLSHTFGHIPDLPWPIKRVLLFGIFGVQLFFLASALTLMMSWARSSGSNYLRCKDFYIHRFLRIAPLYYLAIPFYFLFEKLDGSEFRFSSLMATMLFYNSWSPNFSPPFSSWVPVPGGWSISVEFTFYLLFPLLAVLIKNGLQAIALLGVALLSMVLTGTLGPVWLQSINADVASLFLYYSPTNQLIVFAIGIALYFIAKSDRVRQGISKSKITADAASAAFLVLVLIISYFGQRRLFEFSPLTIPTHALITLCFAIWALIVLVKPNGYTVNKFIVSLGKVSFSVYLVHFAVLGMIDRLLGQVLHFPKTGFMAIAYFFCLTAGSLILSFLIARVTYQMIERPFITLGKNLTKKRVNVPTEPVRPGTSPVSSGTQDRDNPVTSAPVAPAS